MVELVLVLSDTLTRQPEPIATLNLVPHVVPDVLIRNWLLLPVKQTLSIVGIDVAVTTPLNVTTVAIAFKKRA